LPSFLGKDEVLMTLSGLFSAADLTFETGIRQDVANDGLDSMPVRARICLQC
jgi:hypothetical protein